MMKIKKITNIVKKNLNIQMRKRRVAMRIQMMIIKPKLLLK